MISKTCTYGVQAAIYVAARTCKEWVSITEISSNLNISFHFLTKVLQQLTGAGIMASQRGVHGGVMLAKRAEDVSLLDLIRVIDGTDVFEQCMLGLPGCGVAEACPVHDRWVMLRTEIVRVFTATSLDALARDATMLNQRLAHPEALLRRMTL
ncbi:MAG: RrF2 family transcriptional regulator, partial [Candidatus Kapaibacterium sp.]